MNTSFGRTLTSLMAGVVSFVVAASCGSDTTEPTTAPDKIQFTAGEVRALDSTGQVIVQTNPGDGTLKSLVDSTLMVFTVGVEARRVDVNTNLTTKPLYFVGIHRAVAQATGSFSTWTVVGMDDPSHLTSLIEVSGFAQSQSGTAPTSVSGTIGDGRGIVNGTLLEVASGGVVTEWRAGSGTANFSSDPPGAACPGFTPTPKITCAIEVMHVRFAASAANGTRGASARQATVATEVAIPAMRLTYTP
jgi:hypothetical protein